MKRLSDADEERIQAIVDEVRLAAGDDPYIHLMLDELERTVEEAEVTIDNWTLSPQTTEDDWVATD